MKVIEFFEEVTTQREYKGYFYNVEQAIAMVVLGLMSELKNLKPIHRWAEAHSYSENHRS